MNIKDIDKIMNEYKYVDIETFEYVDKPRFFDDPDIIIDDLNEEDRNEFFKNQTTLEIDASIADVICILNKKGYITYSCCGGHISTRALECGSSITPHIELMDYSVPKNMKLPNGFVKNGEYQIVTISSDVVPKNKYKKSSNKKYRGEKLTQEALEEEYQNLYNAWQKLLEWAKSLPDNN